MARCVCALPLHRRRRGSSGRPKTTMRRRKRPRARRRTTTWSSAECVKTEGSCCAATPARPPTTSTAWTRLCPRYPTGSGCVRVAWWACSAEGKSDLRSFYVWNRREPVMEPLQLFYSAVRWRRLGAYGNVGFNPDASSLPLPALYDHKWPLQLLFKSNLRRQHPSIHFCRAGGGCWQQSHPSCH